MNYNLDISPDDEAAAMAALRPTGYRLLVAVAKVNEKVGSLFIPENRLADEEVAAILGKVVAIGGDAYRDVARFPNGPYCIPGDVIMMASYSGRRFKIREREYRLINDDTIMAVVTDPSEIERA